MAFRSAVQRVRRSTQVLWWMRSFRWAEYHRNNFAIEFGRFQGERRRTRKSWRLKRIRRIGQMGQTGLIERMDRASISGLRLHLAVAANEVVGGTVVGKFGLGRGFEFGNDALSEGF